MVLCSFIIYSVIAWLVPKTYKTELEAALNQEVKVLITNLESMDAQNSGVFFDEFQLNNDVILSLYDEFNNSIALPSQYNDDFISGAQTGSMAIESSDGGAYGAMHSYLFSFADSKSVYNLTVAGNAQAVNQLTKTLHNLLPIMIGVILAISVISAVICSSYVTKPVIEISEVSNKMANLDFEWFCEESRQDELGLLASSLNTMSKRLSSAMTQLQDANTQLKADIDQEKKLEQARLEFFSAVSHELKTPITIIKGQLEGMLLNVGKYKEHDKYLARSLEVATTLEGMVQEILTISRIESSSLVLNLEEVALSEMIRSEYAVFEDMIVNKNLSWEADMADDVIIPADKLLIKKVLDNLISNAIHYSPKGNEITITVNAIDGRGRFLIENTGVWIPVDDIPKIFDAFYRIEQSRNRQTGGSGLGLYIVKMILQQHKADFKIENTDKGVRFTVEF